MKLNMMHPRQPPGSLGASRILMAIVPAPARNTVGRSLGRRRGKRCFIRKGLASLAVATAVVGASAGSALAGTNGQELAIEPNCNGNWAYITGHNQSDPYHLQHQWVLVPAVDPGDPWGGCYGLDVYDWGWWWKGWVSIDGYWNRSLDPTGFTGRRWVSVTANQGWWNNWVYTQMP